VFDWPLTRLQDAKESDIAQVNPQMFNGAGDRMYAVLICLGKVVV
jgi:hypothetical protein